MSDKDDDKTGKTYSWQDGMPTKPDVDALMKTWPAPDIGDRFDYATVARLIGSAIDSTRFRTVTTAWRKRMQEKGFVIECDPAKAFYVASADQISAGTYGAINSASRKLRKQRGKLSVAKVETDEQRGIIAHQGRLLHQHERELRKAKMNLLPSTKSAEQPRIAPPNKDEKEQKNG